MKHKKYLSFYSKTEYTRIGGDIAKYPVGSLLFAFLDAPWQEYRNQIEEMKQTCLVETPGPKALMNMQDSNKNYNIVSNFYSGLYTHLSHLHPFLGQIVDERLETSFNEVLLPNYELVADLMFDLFRNRNSEQGALERMQIFEEMETLDSSLVEATNTFLLHLSELCTDMATFQENLIAICDYALDRDTEHGEQPPIRRCYNMHKEMYQPYVDIKNAVELPQVSQEISQVTSSKTFVAHAFYTSTDIRALLFSEFQYMAANDLAICKCRYCNRYFLPHSKASIYCERIVDGTDGKKCKEYAASDKYLQSVSRDEAKKRYSLYRNTYQMRVRRDPETFPYREYETWMEQSKALMKKVATGEVSMEEFERRIALPSTKEVWLS